MKVYKLYIAYLEEVENDEAILAEEQVKAEAEAEALAAWEEDQELREAVRYYWNILTTSTDEAELDEASDYYSDLYKDLNGVRPHYFGENYHRLCEKRRREGR